MCRLPTRTEIKICEGSEPTSVKPMNSESEVIKVLRLLSSPNFFFALAGSLELYVS